MNILKWLKDKTGKLPINLMQAAGITAVVGAAGFAAMSYLNTPTDNTTFMPPSAYEQQGGDVVYVAQGGGGGQYTSNGDVASTFHATAKTLELQDRQLRREQDARALADADVQPLYAEGDDSSVGMPKAYQMGAGEVGLGMGDNGDKQLNGSLDAFANLQKEIPGLGDAINNAQAQAAAAAKGAGQPGAASGNATKGQTAAQLANAPRNWGQGGTVRAGSGSNVNNSFAVQNSGKNQDSNKATADAMAQAGNVMADAQAALKKMQEGSRMQASRASFGNSSGLGEDKDARGQGWRTNYGNARSELAMIRKQSGKIAANNTNSANEGGRPFLSSAQISGGLTVDEGGQVTTGQGSSSGDLSTADRQMRGLKGWAAGVQASQDERDLARHELQNWMWQTFAAVVAMSLAIAILVQIAMSITWPFSWPYWIAAGALTAIACTMTGIFFNKVATYVNVAGAHDKWSTWGYVEGAVLFAGIGAAWVYGLLRQAKSSPLGFKWLLTTGPGLLVTGGFAGGGLGLYKMLINKDQYLKEVAEANQGETRTQEQNKDFDTDGGGN